ARHAAAAKAGDTIAINNSALLNDEDAETREMLRLISTQIARITQVLRDMMNFARTRPPQRAPLDIAGVVEASVRLASFDKAFKRLSLTTELDATAPPISADADQLQQVFLNLLLNARDAMPDGGEVVVRTRYNETKAELVVEVCDTGSGITPEHSAHIFDPFFTTKPAGTGTGLGLAVCYGIITAHGGRIEVTSNNNRGTCARVVLPVNSAIEFSA
ncbi:MAG: ATP-binding protein, partial [Acidobacteriota bacterium]|nr:ATP-binding protein [Acidobacteriota bacterium]